MKRPDIRLDMLMTASHLRLIWRHFATTPERRRALRDGLGMSEEAIEHSASEITVRQQLRAIENANRLLPPGWVLEISELLHFSAFGPIGIAAQTAPTLASSLAILARYNQIRAPMARIRLRRGRTRTHIEVECIADAEMPVWHVVASVAILAIRSLVVAVTGQAAPALRALRYGLSGSPTPQGVALAAALGEPLVFEQARSYIAVPTAWLDIASPFADATLHSSAIAALETMVKAQVGGSFISTQLHNRVAQLLAQAPPGRLDAERCAQIIGVSRRTLTRQLAAEGSGFRTLLEAELQRRAARMLANGEAMADIAEALGYRDTNSLRRALARWARSQA